MQLHVAEHIVLKGIVYDILPCQHTNDCNGFLSICKKVPTIENKNELTLYHMSRTIEPCIMFHSFNRCSMSRTSDKLILRFPGSRLTHSPQCGTTPAFQLKCMWKEKHLQLLFVLLRGWLQWSAAAAWRNFRLSRGSLLRCLAIPRDEIQPSCTPMWGQTWSARLHPQCEA